MTSLTKYVGQYIRDTKALFTNKSPISRINLFLTYNRLVLKNILFTKLVKINTKKEKIFGHVVYYENFNSFFAMFTEIFLHEVYAYKHPKLSLDDKINVVDCGSNIGLSLVYFKLIFPNAAIFCFEPDPITFRILEKNVITNKFKDVKLYQMAVGDKKRKVTLYSFKEFGGGPGNSIMKKHIGFKNPSIIKVDMITLNDIGLEKIDLLKIDVEGAEGKIIEGLSKTKLIRTIKIINLEYHYRNKDNSNRLGKILSFLEENKFSFVINPDTLVGETIDREGFLNKKGYLLIINAFR